MFAGNRGPTVDLYVLYFGEILVPLRNRQSSTKLLEWPCPFLGLLKKLVSLQPLNFLKQFRMLRTAMFIRVIVECKPRICEILADYC